MTRNTGSFARPGIVFDNLPDLFVLFVTLWHSPSEFLDVEKAMSIFSTLIDVGSKTVLN